MNENEMVQDCYKKLNKIGKYKEIHLEVPYMSRCIDMILIKNNDDIITIEFKLSNWKKALKQAKTHRYGANEAYICMPEPALGFKPDFIDELEEKGIGLYKYNPGEDMPLETVVEAKEPQERWQPRMDLLRTMIYA
ncbi:MAG: hypothetical protein ACOCUD_04300 [Bacillota bacterium]